MLHKCWPLMVVAGATAVVSAMGVDAKIDVAELAVRDSIQRGLTFLLSRQRPDGSFHDEPGLRIGVTGLCGLSLLESGGGINREERRQAVDDAVEFLLTRCNEKGVFLDFGTQSVTANHAFALRFLVAAHIGLGAERVPLAVIRRACEALLDGQGDDGGWHHQLDQDSVGDVTNTACTVAALGDCRRLGIEIPRTTFLRAAAFVESCRAPDGHLGYRPLCLKSDPVCTINGEFCHAVADTLDPQPESPRSESSAPKGLADSPLQLYGEYFHMLTVRRRSGTSNELRRSILAGELSDRQRPDGAWDDAASLEFGTAVAVQILCAGLR